MPKTTRKNQAQKLKKMMSGDKLNNDLKTPDYLLQDIEREFGKCFDPCPYGVLEIALQKPELDGLKMEWQDLNFVNPPFNSIKKWLRKGIQEYKKGRKSIFLVTARISSKYWEKFVIPYATEIRFIIGSIVFESETRNYENGLPIPLTIIVFDPTKKHSSLKINNERCYDFWTF